MTKDNTNQVIVTVSLCEAAMIYKLRKFDFGDFRIVKIGGEPRRLVVGGSEMIKPEDGLMILSDPKPQKITTGLGDGKLEM